VNGQERLGTFESGQSDALGRIVENFHGAFTVRSRSRFKNERITVKFLLGLSNKNIEKNSFKKITSKSDYRCAGTLKQKMIRNKKF
jgi:hypothetical protein